MAVTGSGWTGITSLVDDGDAVEAKLTSSFNAIDADLTTLDLAHTALALRVTANEADILTLQTPPDASRLNPVAVAPEHIAGQFYYDSVQGTFQIQGPYDGIEVAPGHGEHLHIINNSGSLIPSGTPVRIAGTSGGIPQIVPAQADTFANANVAGYTVIDIPNATESAIAISGVVKVDTSLLAAGGPYYLSDTVAGALTLTAPAIRTEVGGVLVSDAVDGKFRVDIKTNDTTPSVLGVLQGQSGSGIYALTVTPSVITNYALATSVVTDADDTAGTITLPNDGSYRVTFTANIEFATDPATRSLTIQLYDITGDVVHFPYVKSIPRDSTSDSLSFNWVLPDEVAGRVHSVRILSADNFSITLTEVSFDIESIVIT